MSNLKDSLYRLQSFCAPGDVPSCIFLWKLEKFYHLGATLSPALIEIHHYVIKNIAFYETTEPHLERIHGYNKQHLYIYTDRYNQCKLFDWARFECFDE